MTNMVCNAYRCYRPLPPGFGWLILAAMALGLLIGLSFVGLAVWRDRRKHRSR